MVDEWLQQSQTRNSQEFSKQPMVQHTITEIQQICSLQTKNYITLFNLIALLYSSVGFHS